MTPSDCATLQRSFRRAGKGLPVRNVCVLCTDQVREHCAALGTAGVCVLRCNVLSCKLRRVFFGLCPLLGSCVLFC